TLTNETAGGSKSRITDTEDWVLCPKESVATTLIGLGPSARATVFVKRPPETVAFSSLTVTVRGPVESEETVPPTVIDVAASTAAFCGLSIVSVGAGTID